jgi:hypothetical protein
LEGRRGTEEFRYQNEMKIKWGRGEESIGEKHACMTMMCEREIF